ncbi:SDR family NAD(P)-dependent oxidoreductase [Microlunatus endophyticus]|nr:SDR family oxidoreductase [Microlunatus endophyticus]
MNITGKVFVVTGGGNGIGRAVVLELLKRGGRVLAIDLNENALTETAEIAKAGQRLTTVTLNITDRAAVLDLAAEYDSVDGLVNLAGIIHDFEPVDELDFEVIERVMNVNFWGTVNMTKAFLPVLKRRTEASIVNVASMGSLVPVPGQSAYGASKAAVKLFTEGLYAELRSTSVAVSTVFPGGTATNITGNSGVDTRTVDPEKAKKAAGNLTTPDEAARKITDAIAHGTPRVLIGPDTRALDRLARIAPTRAVTIVAKRMAAIVG